MSDTFGEFVSGTWALKIEDLRPLCLNSRLEVWESCPQKKSAVNEKGLDTARLCLSEVVVGILSVRANRSFHFHLFNHHCCCSSFQLSFSPSFFQSIIIFFFLFFLATFYKALIKDHTEFARGSRLSSSLSHVKGSLGAVKTWGGGTHDIFATWCV